MIYRNSYLNTLAQFRDVNVIKVVTGIRRCGKSTLLLQFRQLLQDSGVQEKNIIFYNLEDRKNASFTEQPDLLHNEILERAEPAQRNYVFIDEVQLVPDFEKMLDSLMLHDNLDLYVTGSNAYMTSSDIATMLSGRYVEIKMQPLSFAEFTEAFSGGTLSRTELFQKYFRYGGFPEVANLLATGKDEQVPLYLSSVYDTVLEKDLRTHKKIRFMDDFRSVVEYLMNNVGNITSPNRISNVLREQNKIIDKDTVSGFLEALKDCFIFYPVERFDIRGKNLLRTLEKYYSVDLGLIDSVLGMPSTADSGHRLENIVFLELNRRYPSRVWVGKNYDKEIDFVCKNVDGTLEYYQVSESITSSDMLNREVSPLTNTGDSYRKTLLTLDLIESDEGGIRKRNIVDWLTSSL